MSQLSLHIFLILSIRILTKDCPRIERRMKPETPYRRLGAKGSYLTLVRVADRIV